MKSFVFTLSVLALMAFVQTIPCEWNRCGKNSYEYASANVASSDEHEFGEENNGGDGAGYSGGSAAGYEGGGGGSSAYQGGGGWGNNGGGGGGYNSRTKTSSYCPNCDVNDFGHDLVNRNTIYIDKK